MRLASTKETSRLSKAMLDLGSVGIAASSAVGPVVLRFLHLE